MKEYKSLDIVEIAGRGKVFVVENDTPRRRDINDLIGSEVIIDGKVYKVRAVESHAINDISVGQRIGLLV